MAIVTSAVAIVTSAKTSHVSSAEATHVTSTETAHVTSSAKAAAVEATATKAATTEAAAPVSAATASTTAACLCTRRKQRPGKQGGCQYHHRLSSSHVFSFRRAEPSVIIELVSLASYDRPAAHG
jgi:hypothetical protein